MLSAIRSFSKDSLKTASAAKNVGGKENPSSKKGVPQKGRAKSVCATPTGQNHMSILRDAINQQKLRRASVPMKKDTANEAEAKAELSKANPFQKRLRKTGQTLWD